MRTSDKQPARAPAATNRRPGAVNGQPRLRLSIQHATTSDGLPARSTLRRWVLGALDRRVTTATITLRFVGTAEARALNRRYRERDYATNVLSFDYRSMHDGAGAGVDNVKGNVEARDAVIGDVVLCVPVLKREARAQRKPLRAHCAHLVVHGTLHLQGFDHLVDKDATVMEALETRLLATLGYGDPYERAR